MHNWVYKILFPYVRHKKKLGANRKLYQNLVIEEPWLQQKKKDCLIAIVVLFIFRDGPEFQSFNSPGYPALDIRIAGLKYPVFLGYMVK